MNKHYRCELSFSCNAHHHLMSTHQHLMCKIQFNGMIQNVYEQGLNFPGHDVVKAIMKLIKHASNSLKGFEKSIN